MDAISVIKRASQKVSQEEDLGLLLQEIGEARFVLLGEASHGTHEYYTWRSRISKKLIEQKGFTIVAVEGDWPDCYRLNRYIKSYPDSGNCAKDVLSEFNRWPTWMWANWEVAAFAEWLKSYNQGKQGGKKAGFYGLDVYSLWESMEAIFIYLNKKDPVAFQSVKKAMDCFEPFNVREGFSYAERSYGLSSSCAGEVVKMLSDIRTRLPSFDTDDEAVFNAEQNALVAVNAERYYQAMLSGGDSTWNIRDTHMTETAERLIDFYGPDSRIIIWEHNTHIGDAAATDMKRAGLVNIGQLLKDRHSDKGVYRIGFGSYEGTVIAGREWGAEMQVMPVPIAQAGSWEKLVHDAGAYNKILFSKDIRELDFPIGHRAIGVVYNPGYEFGNYVPSIMPKRYEAFIHLERSSALHPMHILADSMQMPETYPWGV